jgi:hypothetical protein
MVIKKRAVSRALVGAVVLILLGWPLVELHSWAPYYSFYLNSIGGGTNNVTRYFGPDEVSEFDTREVAQQVCPSAAVSTRVATARPMSMGYYLEACGRTDLQIVPLYDARYHPRDGDLVILEPSRRFFETQRYFDTLKDSGMSHRDVRVGPVLASTIYLFDPSVAEAHATQKSLTVTQLPAEPPGLGTYLQKLWTRNTSSTTYAQFSGRHTQ